MLLRAVERWRVCSVTRNVLSWELFDSTLRCIVLDLCTSNRSERWCCREFIVTIASSYAVFY